jgi:hypothetical protein
MEDMDVTVTQQQQQQQQQQVSEGVGEAVISFRVRFQKLKMDRRGLLQT